MTKFTGTSGDDTLTGTSGNDKFLLGQGGNDTVSGGGGADTFSFDASLTAADKIDGGTGDDIVSLAGNYAGTHALVFGAATLSNVETVAFAAGFSYGITTNDSNVADGALLNVRGQTMTSADTLTFDGSAETNGKFEFYAGAGNDVLTGGAGADTFKLDQGGADTAHGGGGNDTFFMGAVFGATDQIDGGAGSDTVILSGTTIVTLGVGTLANVETVRLSAGYGYYLSFADANVGAGQSLTVDGRAGNVFSFDGALETDGHFKIYDGAGNDWLRAGAGNDIFNLSSGGLDTAIGGGGNDVFNISGSGTVAITGGDGNDVISFNRALQFDDTVDGGKGSDTLVIDGDYPSGSLGPRILNNIETVRFAAGHDYNFYAGQIVSDDYLPITFNGSALGPSDSLTINAGSYYAHAYEPPNDWGHVTIVGGAGNDTFTGSGMNDVLKGGDGNDTLIGSSGPDTETGGNGADTFRFSFGDSSGVYFDTIKDFDASQDLLDLWVTPTSIAAPVTTNVSSREWHHFDAYLTGDLAGLLPSQAVVYSVTGGAYAGHTFVVVNTGTTQGFNPDNNFIVDITGATHMSAFSLLDLT